MKTDMPYTRLKNKSSIKNEISYYGGVNYAPVFDYEYDIDRFALEAMPQNKPGKENYDQKRYEELRETLMYRLLPPLAQ